LCLLRFGVLAQLLFSDHPRASARTKFSRRRARSVCGNGNGASSANTPTKSENVTARTGSAGVKDRASGRTAQFRPLTEEHLSPPGHEARRRF
jgi:hypothetical protein